MFAQLVTGLTLLTALGCAIVGGTFYGFSAFIMRSLGRLPAAQGIAAMNAINVVVINPWFMVPFVGTALAALALVVVGFLRLGERGAPFLLAGGLLYLLGSFAATLLFNVPRNDALLAVAPESAAGAAYWADYLRGWTAWNTARTVASLAALLALILALALD